MKNISKYFYTSIHTVGEFTLFSLKVFYYSFKRPFRIPLIISQLNIIGIHSILIISISNFAIGMIFALQIAVALAAFGAESLTANILAQALARELCPVITSLMLIAKNGSAFASEISSMVSSEQISVMNTMGINPIKYVVTPRLIASIIMYPMLTGLANVSGLFGASIILFGLLRNVETAFAIEYMFNKLHPFDIITGLFKSLVMGVAICQICCFYGLRTKKGSTGIGQSTITAVVVSSITILLIDLFLGQLYLRTGILQ